MMSSSLSSSSTSSPPMSMSTSRVGPFPAGLGVLSCGRSVCFCPPVSGIVFPALRPARYRDDLHLLGALLHGPVHELLPVVALLYVRDGVLLDLLRVQEQIGRASCRERV